MNPSSQLTSTIANFFMKETMPWSIRLTSGLVITVDTSGLGEPAAHSNDNPSPNFYGSHGKVRATLHFQKMHKSTYSAVFNKKFC